MATGRRRGRAIIFIALILILLLVVVYVVAQMYPLSKASAPQATGVKGVEQLATPTQTIENIIVTAQDVRRGQELTDDLLAIVPAARDESLIQGNYFRTKAEAIGTRARYDLKAHTAINATLIVKQGSPDQSIPSFDIPVGKVAISIPISRLSSAAYGIQKGDHVNIIASILMVDLDTTFQSALPNRSGYVVAPGPIGGDNEASLTARLFSPSEYAVAAADAASFLGRIEMDPTMNSPVYVLPSETQRPRIVSQTLIQDAMVLQMGTFSLESLSNAAASAQPTATPTAQPRQQQEAAAPAATPPDIITLVVDPQDAVSLNYLMLAGGNLNLVLRSAGDQTLKDTEAVTLQFILDQYRIPNPAKLPYGTEPRVNKFPSQVMPFPEPGTPNSVPSPNQ